MTTTDLLTVKETADRLGVSRRSVYRYIERGDLKAVRTAPRKTYVPRGQVAAFLGRQQATLESDERRNE